MTNMQHEYTTNIKRIRSLEDKCPICRSEDHTWQEIYIASKSKLTKMESKSVSWCEKVKDYVFITKANRILRPNE